MEENITNSSKVILIAGPTASGKSALALALAAEFGGAVINADSMQVYRELRILTNRPTPEDEAQVPHLLYGFRPAAEAYSTALWLNDLKRTLHECAASGRVPVIVGGTGLYFKALFEGLSAIPPIPQAIREEVRAKAASLPAPALHDELKAIDPKTASQLRPSDPQRIARALEVMLATGTPLAEWQTKREPPLIKTENAYKLVVTEERSELYEACDRRFDWMIANGAIEEVEALAHQGLDPSLPAMRSHGTPELLAYIEGRLSLTDAVAKAKANTRHYVKRQHTWINSNFIDWKTYNKKYYERTKGNIKNFLQNALTAAF